MSTCTESTTVEQITAEGAEVLTWGRDGQRCANIRSGGCTFSVPIWTGKRYRAVRRQSDGVLTWRLVATHGPSVSGRTASDALIARVRQLATEMRIPFAGVTHGQRCD